MYLLAHFSNQPNVDPNKSLCIHRKQTIKNSNNVWLSLARFL